MEEYINQVYQYVCLKGGKVNLGDPKVTRPPGPQGKMKLKEVFALHGKSHFTLETVGSGTSSECFLCAIPDPDSTGGSASPPVVAPNPTPEDYVNEVYRYVCEKGGKVDLSDIANISGLKRPYFPQGKMKLRKILEVYGKSRFTLETVGSGLSAKCFAIAFADADIASESISTPGETFNLTPIGKMFSLDEKTNWCYVTEPEKLELAVERVFADVQEADEQQPQQPQTQLNPSRFVSIDCECANGNSLELLQVATGRSVYVFDCQQMGARQVCKALERLLHSESPIKLIHDLHPHATALKRLGGIELVGVLDTQLVAEFLWNKPFKKLNDFLSELQLPTHPSKDFVAARIKGRGDLWRKRPVDTADLEYAARNVAFLSNAADALRDGLLTPTALHQLLEASSARVRGSIRHGGLRAICFDKHHDFAISSTELTRIAFPDRGFYGEKLEVRSDVTEVFDVLPSVYKTKLVAPVYGGSTIMDVFRKRNGSGEESTATTAMIPPEHLSDLNLDVGRRAQCWVRGKRVFLSDDPEKRVTSEEIEEVAAELGTFGSDNRAGLPGSLHRFSRLNNRNGRLAGLTIRVGRTVKGNASMLMDLLLASTDRSILVLGEPGSGKTTIVREATRILARTKNVMVVDTSNEIAGDGAIPHSCIGDGRRMMVPSLDKQSAVMVECVQNHTPEVMVIDEIGRSREVLAADTVKQRGVRMIASAHGDLRKLVKNKDLNGLVGGLESTTLGDDLAREEAKRRQTLVRQQTGEDRPLDLSKQKTSRKGDPTFEIVVEVSRASHHEWRIVTDSARAVDRILEGLLYRAQLRKRDPETGEMWMGFVDV